MRGEHFSPDVRELIETLTTHGVRFLLVGGEAVIYHAVTPSAVPGKTSTIAQAIVCCTEACLCSATAEP